MSNDEQQKQQKNGNLGQLSWNSIGKSESTRKTFRAEIEGLDRTYVQITFFADIP